VVELLMVIGMVWFAVFVVGAVMLHILVGLVLLPFKLAFGLLQGLAWAALALPFVAFVAILGIAVASIGLVAALACVFGSLLL
jgi:hypothetical protein